MTPKSNNKKGHLLKNIRYNVVENEIGNIRYTVFLFHSFIFFLFCFYHVGNAHMLFFNFVSPKIIFYYFYSTIYQALIYEFVWGRICKGKIETSLQNKNNNPLSKEH